MGIVGVPRLGGFLWLPHREHSEDEGGEAGLRQGAPVDRTSKGTRGWRTELGSSGAWGLRDARMELHLLRWGLRVQWDGSGGLRVWFGCPSASCTDALQLFGPLKEGCILGSDCS